MERLLELSSTGMDCLCIAVKAKICGTRSSGEFPKGEGHWEAFSLVYFYAAISKVKKKKKKRGFTLIKHQSKLYFLPLN